MTVLVVSLVILQYNMSMHYYPPAVLHPVCC